MITLRLKSPNSVGETPIRIHCYFDSKEIVLYSHQKIHPDLWVKSKQRVSEDKIDNINGRKVNFELSRLENIAKGLQLSSQKNMEEFSEKNFVTMFKEKAFGTKPKRRNVNNMKVSSSSAFFINYDSFIEFSGVSEGRRNHFKSVKQMLQRYEMYVRIKSDGKFKLSLETINGDVVRDFVDFLVVEHKVFKEFPKIYEMFNERGNHKERGVNRIIGIAKIVRTFIIYCEGNGINVKNPFKTIVKKVLIEGKEELLIINGYAVKAEKYADPIFLTQQERFKLQYFDLSKFPELEVQRDIFIFQCQVGCRVGDLYKFEYQNIINGVLHYVALKTIENKQDTVTVPLNTTALELIAKYKDRTNNMHLFPYITEVKYNRYLKRIFKIVDLTRTVVTLGPDGKVFLSTLDKEASSHMARKTFIGNIYDQVQDPNVIGSMTGHVEGSKAFNRYKHVNDDIKRKTIDFLG